MKTSDNAAVSPTTSTPTGHREELRLLYQISVNDLTYFKAQQWSVTNYALLLYAGVVGIAQMLKADLGFVDRMLLVTVALATGATALFILSKLQKSVSVREARLDAVRTQLSEAFRFAWSAEEKGKERVHAIYLLRAAVVVGAAAAVWLAGWRIS